MAEWTIHVLRDFVDPTRSICYGIVQPGSHFEGGVPVVRVNNFSGGILDVTKVLCVDSSIEQTYSRSRLHGGELLVTLVGSMGLTAIVPGNMRGWNVARAVGVVPLRSDADKRWINFVVRSGPAQDFIRAHANTTVQATFNLKDLANLPIPLPPDDVRLPMTALLSALDDKIELNRRINETLEAMARAIFKDWFVDFGPIRAKAEGRAPYFAPEIGSLFPDRLDGENKPEGWGRETLGSIAARTKGEIRTGPFGSQLHQSDYVMQGTPVVMPSNLTSREIVEDNIARIGPETLERLAGHQLRTGDIVYGRRGDIGRKALVGPNENGWFCGTGCLRIRVATTECPPIFLFHHLDQPAVRDWIVARAIGATMPNLNTSILGEVEVLLPGKDLCTAFVDMCSPLDNRARIAQAESKSLATLRDLLLPKLMSGEIRVKDAEKMVEEAV